MNFEALVQSMEEAKQYTASNDPIALVMSPGVAKRFTKEVLDHCRSLVTGHIPGVITEFNGAYVQEGKMWPANKVFICQGHYLLAVFDMDRGDVKNLWEDVGLRINARVETIQ